MSEAKGLLRFISCTWFDAMTAKFEKSLTSCQHCPFFHQQWKERRQRLQGLPLEESRLSWASETCQKTTLLNDHMYSPHLWCH